ncbi:MAG: hypothetical protein RLZZ324_1042 [Candidatus Parcubacteria bacterium]
MSLNRAQIIGNLTRDPEVRTTPAGQQVASFGVATNSTWTDSAGVKQERAEFHNIVAWGKLADICGQYLNKGRKVFIEGRLQTRDWEGQDGQKRSRTEIVAESMIMLDRGTGAPGAAQGQRATATATAAKSASAEAGSEDEIKVEDIPF